MGFFVLGVNHQECPIEVRERLHFTPRQCEAALSLSKGHPEIAELVIVSTCNRVEFYGFSETKIFPEAQVLGLIEKIHGIHPQDFSKYLYRRQSEEAMRHLFRVASGLDSLVVGENEILGQLREAFRTANTAGTVHAFLYRLLEKALKTGKEVRTETRINEGAVSVASVAVELAEKIFSSLRGKKIMVLGTGEMSAQTLKCLSRSGADALYVASRQKERGGMLAAEFGAEWIAFESWDRHLAGIDILIASTAAPHPVVRVETVKQMMAARRRRPLFLIDIAVPRDVEPEVNTLDDVYLYNLDDLKGVAEDNLKLRRKEVLAAEALVEQAVLGFRRWIGQLEARPTLERFENFLDELLEKELDLLARKTGAGETEKKEARQRIRAKLLHHPHEKIKEASENGGVTRYLEALQSLFDLDRE